MEILWNIPSEHCQKNVETKISLAGYNIKTNENYTFRGNKIVILYENEVGLYPHIKNHSNGTIEYINGGLPQLVNITEHLKKLEGNINNIIKDVNFSGLAIIDIEEWRPTYDSNWSSKRIYQNQSIELVLNTTNITDANQAKQKAIEDFDKAAIDFFNKTLHKCKELRPKAKWGFYGFPTCNENAQNRNWSFCFPAISNKTIPIFKHVDVMYPAPYIVKGQNYSVKNLFVQAVLTETQRIVKIIKGQGNSNKPIYAYQKFEVDPFLQNIQDIEFYDPYYLCIAYKNMIYYKVDGIIVWTTSRNMRDRCPYIKRYTDKVFGPYVKNLNESFLISSQTTISLNTISQTTLSSRQMGSLTTSTFSLNDCNKLLTEDNFNKWCETYFYGPDCLDSKRKSSGITKKPVTN